MTVNITFALFLLNLLLSATPSVFFTRELIGLSCCSPSLPFSLAVVFPSDAAFINFLYSDISILRRFSSSNWANLRCWTEGCSINKEFFNPYITGAPEIYMETNKVHEQIDATRIRSEEGFTWFRFLREKKRYTEQMRIVNTTIPLLAFPGDQRLGWQQRIAQDSYHLSVIGYNSLHWQPCHAHTW